MKRKQIISLLLLLIISFLTVYTIFRENDLQTVITSMAAIKVSWLAAAIILALLFISTEGIIICYLINSLNIPVRLAQCICWSFIGFFFSGITPSATGGQPVQLYYMKRAGVDISRSMPVLMLTAVLYKLVLVLIGIGITIFWGTGLSSYLGGYTWIFFLGIGINIVVVVILLFVMFSSTLAKKTVLKIEKLLIRLRIFKPSEERTRNWLLQVETYNQAMNFFVTHKRKILIVTALTFVQRVSVFCLPCLIYFGLGLSGTAPVTLILLQAIVIIAVDMLPLPGSAGVSEFMYSVAFSQVFSGSLLAASLCLSRGVSFYLPLLLSALVWIIVHIMENIIDNRSQKI